MHDGDYHECLTRDDDRIAFQMNESSYGDPVQRLKRNGFGSIDFPTFSILYDDFQGDKMSQDKAQAKESNSVQNNMSDGSELIPAEVQAAKRHQDDNQPTNQPTKDVPIPGSTVDDEGRINNFATEPKVYKATYPSPVQQRKYVLWGAAALVLVSILVFISFAVS